MTASWLTCFETVCALYQCRPIEIVARNAYNRIMNTTNNTDINDDHLFIGGPSGFWLSEVTSVEFNEDGALLPACNDALLHLAQFVMLNNMPAPLVAIDSFVIHTTRHHGARRQCLVRIDANNRAIFVTLLANSVRNASLNPAGLAYSRYTDRLRPFTIMLMCEILERDVSVQVLNMHGEPFMSSTRWLYWHCLEQRCDEVKSTTDSYDLNGESTLINQPGWLDVIRDAHTRGRWIRVMGYANVTANSIVSECSLSGSMRYMWRNCHPVRAGSRVSECPVGWLLPLRTLECEISSKRPSLLSLCDFNVWMRRTNNLLVNTSTDRTRKRNLCWIREISIRNELEDNDESSRRHSQYNDQNGKGCNYFENASRRASDYEKYSSPAIETLREKRYFVRADGRLAAARFVSLS